MAVLFATCSFYKFVSLSDYAELKQPLLEAMQANDLYGTILLAQEGVNGTISGSEAKIDSFLIWLSEQPGLAGVDIKKSYHHEVPFYRTKVKLKREIVTMGVDGIDPKHSGGIHIEPDKWNALISDPEVLVVDTRNDYEIGIGSFENAIDPGTKTFRDFPEWAKNNLDPKKHKKIAMFCTGGIRCEKSTAYVKELGFENVYQLRGGILNYFEEVPSEQSMWGGECFVFDNRVAVNHNLEKGSYDQCHACRMPITESDKEKPSYIKGESCHLCQGTHDERKQKRFSERQKQMVLAKSRGEAHIGATVQKVAEHRRAGKRSRRGYFQNDVE